MPPQNIPPSPNQADSQPGIAGTAATGSWRTIKDRASKLASIWTLVTVGLVLVCGAGFFFWYTHRPTKKADTLSSNFGTVTLKDLPNQASLGQNGQTLTVNADSYFGGNLQANKDLGVKGNAAIAGTTTLKDLQVVGALTAGTLNLKSGLSVASVSATSLLSTVDLTASGNGSFGGSLSAGTINARNLTVTGHYVSAGQTPGVSGGTAVGSGGTVSISGNDTTGTVTINVGSGAPAGILASVSFKTPYGSTPHVNLTPLTTPAASLPYYVTRSTGGFVINAAAAPGSGTYSFDYFIAQ